MLQNVYGIICYRFLFQNGKVKELQPQKKSADMDEEILSESENER